MNWRIGMKWTMADQRMFTKIWADMAFGLCFHGDTDGRIALSAQCYRPRTPTQLRSQKDANFWGICNKRPNRKMRRWWERAANTPDSGAMI